jgi:TfoX/Sxy family transcriptional regulator of competence genes
VPGFDKSPPDLVTRFDAVAARFPDVERRLTFGYPCLYVGGNMVSGLHQDAWFVRLGGRELAESLALAGAQPFEPMAGRPMTGYTLLPQAVIDDDDAIGEWVQRAIDFGATLPPKVPKTRNAKPTPQAK